MEVGGETHAVVADDAIHIPAGVPHSLRVSEKLVALQCYSPGGPEQRFKKPAPSHQLPEAEKR
jgi:mannose-6-phosphate isomerase-like protein (cupin superfamily)